MSQQKSRDIKASAFFQLSNFTVLLNHYELTCCALTEAFLHTLVVFCFPPFEKQHRARHHINQNTQRDMSRINRIRREKLLLLIILIIIIIIILLLTPNLYGITNIPQASSADMIESHLSHRLYLEGCSPRSTVMSIFGD